MINPCHTHHVKIGPTTYRAVFNGKGFRDLRYLARKIIPVGKSAHGRQIRTHERQVNIFSKEANRVVAALEAA